MGKAKVSVIIPVYNTEHYLQRCLDSVLGQTLRELEIILVDDGSTDSSGALCDAFARQDPRVRVVHRENGGAGLARNDGIALAGGAYAAFMDSDDYIAPDMYETLYHAAVRERADAAVGGYCQCRNGQVVEEKPGSFGGVYRGQAAMEAFFLEVLGSEPTCRQDFRVLWRSPWLSLYSLELIRRHGIRFDSEREIISEDHLFNMKFFSRATCVCVLERVFVYHCRNEQSLTRRSYSHDLYLKATRLYHEQLARVAALGFSPDYLPQAKTRLQRNYLAHVRASVHGTCAKARDRGEAVRIIAGICRLEDLQAVLREYPWTKGPLKQRVFNLGLRCRLPGLVYLLVRARGAS